MRHFDIVPAMESPGCEMGDVILEGRRGEMPVYVAGPEEGSEWPGVVVISDALGMTTDLRNQADWLATNGYLAAAPDLYYWGGRVRCMFSVIRQILKREGDAFDDMEIVRRWLVEHGRSSGRVGVIGFCMGGGFALLLAGIADYQVASVNYGAVPKDSVELLSNSCPIVGSYGGRDKSLADAPGLLEHALGVNGITHDVKTYPDAGHAFMNDPDLEEVPTWAVVAGKLSYSEYDAAAAADARQRIVAFFDDHLTQASGR